MYIYIYMYVYIYTYTYAHTYKYIHTYIKIYIQLDNRDHHLGRGGHQTLGHSMIIYIYTHTCIIIHI